MRKRFEDPLFDFIYFAEEMVATASGTNEGGGYGEEQDVDEEEGTD